MVFKNEGAFSARLSMWMSEAGFTIQDIESGGTSVGIPDKYFSSFSMQGWLELKNMGRVLRDVEVDFRPGQYPWLRRFSRNGTFCALLVSHDDGIAMFPGSELAVKYTARDFLAATVETEKDRVIERLNDLYKSEKEVWSSFHNRLERGGCSW